MMNNKIKKQKIPQLRFPEFKNAPEWEVKKLEEVLNYEQPNKYIVKNPYYQNIGTPVLTANKSFILGYTNELNGIYENIPAIIFDDFTTDKKYVDFTFKVKSSAIKILKSKNKNNLKFLFETMTLINFDAEQHKRYYISEYQNLLVRISKPKEQQKIADCLKTLDNLITAQTKKIEALKEHKKGLMQNLFPAEDEKIPKLRFPKFENDGEWEEKEVGELFQVTRGYVLSMNLVTNNKTKKNIFPVYSSKTKNNGLTGYYSTYLYKNAITWTTDGANAGDVNYRKGKFYCTNVCGVLLNNKGYANLCIAEIIHSVSKEHVSYVGNPKLMNGVMSKILIKIPSLKEQQKIADCLRSLDNLITAQTKKIEALKKHKKALLQQLFV